MLFWTGLIATRLSVDERTNEDLTQSFSDKSRRLPQTSHSTEQSVFSSECVRVDTRNQPDTAEDCKQSDTPCDAQMHVESEVCSGTFTHAQSHIQIGERSFSCEVCSKKFESLSDLIRHVNTGEHLYSCEVCDKQFAQLFNLTIHMRSHNGERPFSCEVCDKQFARSCTLKSHMRFHNDERSFSCKVCSKKFKSSSNLIRHFLIHRGERPFRCELCNKTFKQSGSLKCHMHIHRSERFFSCKVCSKKFKSSSNLIRHFLIHRGERPFSCELCNKTFTQSGSLKCHMHIHNYYKRLKRHVDKHVYEATRRSAICMETEQSSTTDNSDTVDKFSKKTHICSTCGRTFQDERLFETHMRLHSRLETLYQRN